MSTVRDILEDSLSLLGILDPAEGISAEMAKKALRRLNSMLDTWSTQGLLVYTLNREVYNFTVGKAVYTLGTGGDFNTPRPIWFNMASVIPLASAPTLEIPLRILSDDEWRSISIKVLNSTFPLYIWPQGNFPLNSISVWPVPTAACQIVLYLPQQLGSFADVNATVSLPPGYEEAITYNLASKIAPMYGISTPPDVARAAINALDSLRSQNLITPILEVDSAMCGNMPGPTSQAIRSKGYVVD